MPRRADVSHKNLLTQSVCEYVAAMPISQAIFSSRVPRRQTGGALEARMKELNQANGHQSWRRLLFHCSSPPKRKRKNREKNNMRDVILTRVLLENG